MRGACSCIKLLGQQEPLPAEAKQSQRPYSCCIAVAAPDEALLVAEVDLVLLIEEADTYVCPMFVLLCITEGVAADLGNLGSPGCLVRLVTPSVAKRYGSNSSVPLQMPRLAAAATVIRNSIICIGMPLEEENGITHHHCCCV